MVGTRGLGVALTFLDQCVHHPVFYFPSFYALKGLVEGRTLGSSMKVRGTGGGGGEEEEEEVRHGRPRSCARERGGQGDRR